MFRHLIYLVIIGSLAFSIVSCSNSKPVVKSDNSSMEPANQILENNTPERAASLDFGGPLVFPLSEDPDKLLKLYRKSMRFLERGIYLYRNIYGHFPRSIAEYLESGFPIFWPRNPITGEPYKLSNSPLEEARKDLIGTFNYDYENDDKVILRYVYFDREASKDSGEEVYGINTIPIEPLTGRLEGGLYVMGGTESFDSLQASEDKQIYAIAGHLNNVINLHINNYYENNGIVPNSFNQIFPCYMFFIRENLDSFTKNIQRPDIVFEWGFDDSTTYTVLDFDGKRFIDHCIVCDDKSGGRYNCDVDTLDRSTPLLNKEILLSLKIPDDYLISVDEILE